MSIIKKIAKNLKTERKCNGYTQQQAAKILYMTQSQYSRFENGLSVLNYEQILAVCKLYDITPNELFEI